MIGLSRALDMILTGRPVDAVEPFRMGLIDRLVAPDTELQQALDLAEAIAAFPQATVRSDRAAVLGGLGLPLDEGLALEARLGREVLGTAAEGARRFSEGEGRGGSGV